MKKRLEGITKRVIDKLHSNRTLYSGGFDGRLGQKRFFDFIVFIINTTIKETLKEFKE